MQPPHSQTAAARKNLFTLGLLFGSIYFVQGIAEPTEGLIAQPVRSLLNHRGHSAGEISGFAAMLAIPWSLKPLYGLLSDFVPLAGYRRKSYLILTSTVTIIGLVVAAWAVARGASISWLMWLLLAPTLAVAFSDVVADALMVEHGQPLGITGQLQSVQWSAMYAATIVAGPLGGYLSEHRLEPVAMLVCAGFMAVTLVLSLTAVREPIRSGQADDLRTALRLLWQAVRSPGLPAICAFLFLWSFNPFSTTVQYLHMTRELGFSQTFSGWLTSLLALGALLGSVAYGFYSRRLSRRVLVHASIVMGVINTAAYWDLESQLAAAPVTLIVGFVWMTGTLIQFDLAAQSCPPRVAGTVFAVLMAVSNLAVALSMELGGHWYEQWSAVWGSRTAFNLLVAVGTAFTAACWLLTPWLTEEARVGASES
jgi:predicted MFS family arabinose efflux permease